jgi:hypothetical protein
MASAPESAPVPECFADAPMVARDVARGVCRLFFRQDLFALCEVPLPNGRRADLMAIDGKGCLTIVEIKVSRADLRGDAKWPDYLDYCDRFFWAVRSIPHQRGVIAIRHDQSRYLRPECRLGKR